jgi:hypothetical protein
MIHAHLSSSGIEIDGVLYVPAIEAGRESGLTGDYIARLARSGRIPARRLGRNWYVDQHAMREKKLRSPGPNPSLA